jgi:hypothetical protein
MIDNAFRYFDRIACPIKQGPTAQLVTYREPLGGTWVVSYTLNGWLPMSVVHQLVVVMNNEGIYASLGKMLDVPTTTGLLPQIGVSHSYVLI